jgi:hypothetical protein
LRRVFAVVAEKFVMGYTNLSSAKEWLGILEPATAEHNIGFGIRNMCFHLVLSDVQSPQSTGGRY